MIQKLSNMCAKNIISLGGLQDVNESVLRYGCELIITSIIGLLILIVLSLIIGHPIAWVFFVLAFAIHRTSAGGYHAASHAGCFLVTSAMFLIGAIISIKVEWHYLAYLAIAVFSAVLVILLAPLEAANKPLSKKCYRTNRKRSFWVVAINIIISVFFAMMSLACEEANLYFAGIFFATFSLIMGKIKNSLKGGKRNEG